MKKTDSQVYQRLQEIPEKFCYLMVGHLIGNAPIGEDRKNVTLLIKAFYETFKNKQQTPALILKTSRASSSYMDRREIQKVIDNIRKSVGARTLPNIYLLHGDFKDHEMNELYNHPKVKAMVMLTKGEGFGRPLLEFSLTNKPIITTGWSGHIDFLKPEFSALIGGELKPIHQAAQVKDMLIEGSQWFSPDHGQIGYFMKDVYEKYKDWKVKGKRQGYYSRSSFNFDKMQEKLGEILDKNIPELPKRIELKLPEKRKIKLPKLVSLKENTPPSKEN